jgi:hypothetical protein
MPRATPWFFMLVPHMVLLNGTISVSLQSPVDAARFLGVYDK